MNFLNLKRMQDRKLYHLFYLHLRKELFCVKEMALHLKQPDAKFVPQKKLLFNVIANTTAMGTATVVNTN